MDFKRVAAQIRAVSKPRLAKRAAIGLLGAYLFYLLVINVALATGLVARLISRQPDHLQVQYDSAWSWWPGRVHARGLRLRGADTMIEWQVGLDDVRFTTSLIDLFHRRFHASHIRSTGVTARGRMKLDAKQVTPEVLSVLPPIEGFTDPPLKPAVPRPDVPDKDYKLWSMQLEDVDAEGVREVWFGAYRFAGLARITGNFALRPLRLVMVGPAMADVIRGDLHVGREAMMDGLTGHLEATVVPFDPRLSEGAELLRFMTITARGDGHVAGMRFLNHYFPKASEPKLDGGAGLAHVEVRILAGVLSAPSTATVDSTMTTLTDGGHRVSVSAAHLTVVVEENDGHTEGRASSDMSEVDVQRIGAAGPLVRAPRAGLQARSSKLDLVKPFEDMIVSANVPDAVMPDLREIDPYLGKKDPSVRAGVAHLTTKLTAAIATHTVQGELGVTASGLAVRDGDIEVRGTLGVALKLDALDYVAHHADISGSRLEIRDVSVSSAANDPNWWGRMEVEHAKLSYGSAPRFQAGLSLQARDARPILRAYAVKDPGLPSWVANLFTLRGLHGGAALTVADAQVDVRGLHLVGGAFDIRGELQKRGATTNGIALISSGPLALGIVRKNDSTELKLVDAVNWYRQTTAVHGTN